MSDVDDRATKLGRDSWTALRKLVRELLARKPGGHLITADLRQVDLHLRLDLRDGDDRGAAFSEEVVGSIERALDDAVQHAAAFRPGHAFCHRCGGPVCEHSQPPSSRHVFAGYGPTGSPRWEDFAQLCLDRKHPDVDRLFEAQPPLITLVLRRSELRTDLLPVFANGDYELVGQALAGFFPVQTRLDEGRGVLALSFQVGATRFRRGGVRLGLNVLGRDPSGAGLAMLWERHRDLPWRKPVLWAQDALLSVERSARRGSRRHRWERVESRVEGVLNGLARRLQRDIRARRRRTRHAESRHDSGERPTRKAIDDARGAGEDALLVDERSGAIVVLGERGRTHFFNEKGRLVSSVRYSRDAIERKRARGNWRPATAGEVEEFRGAIG